MPYEKLYDSNKDANERYSVFETFYSGISSKPITEGNKANIKKMLSPSQKLNNQNVYDRITNYTEIKSALLK
jgi:hypothetical protein